MKQVIQDQTGTQLMSLPLELRQMIWEFARPIRVFTPIDITRCEKDAVVSRWPPPTIARLCSESRRAALKTGQLRFYLREFAGWDRNVYQSPEEYIARRRQDAGPPVGYASWFDTETDILHLPTKFESPADTHSLIKYRSLDLIYCAKNICVDSLSLEGRIIGIAMDRWASPPPGSPGPGPGGPGAEDVFGVNLAKTNIENIYLTFDERLQATSSAWIQDGGVASRVPAFENDSVAIYDLRNEEDIAFLRDFDRSGSYSRTMPAPVNKSDALCLSLFEEYSELGRKVPCLEQYYTRGQMTKGTGLIRLHEWEERGENNAPRHKLQLKVMSSGDEWTFAQHLSDVEAFRHFLFRMQFDYIVHHVDKAWQNDPEEGYHPIDHDLREEQWLAIEAMHANGTFQSGRPGLRRFRWERDPRMWQIRNWATGPMKVDYQRDTVLRVDDIEATSVFNEFLINREACWSGRERAPARASKKLPNIIPAAVFIRPEKAN